MMTDKPNPLLDAAIRAGCESQTRQDDMICFHPDALRSYTAQAILAYLDAAMQSPEIGGALRDAILACDAQSTWDSISPADCWKAGQAALRALKAQVTGE